MANKLSLTSRVGELKDRALQTKEHAHIISGAIARVKDTSEPLMESILDIISLSLEARAGTMTRDHLFDVVEENKGIFAPNVSFFVGAGTVMSFIP